MWGPARCESGGLWGARLGSHAVGGWGPTRCEGGVPRADVRGVGVGSHGATWAVLGVVLWWCKCRVPSGVRVGSHRVQKFWQGVLRGDRRV